MNRQIATRLAWALVGLTCLMVVAATWLSLSPGDSINALVVLLIPVLLPLAFAIVGAIIAQHHPANPIGWILCGYGALLSIGIFSETYPAALPGAVWLWWESTWGWAPGIFSLVTLVPLLFPSGRLPSPRWRWVVWLAITGIMLIVLAQALYPGPMVATHLINPIGIEGAAGLLDVFYRIGMLSVAGSALASITSAALRFRRSHGDERQQLKWFVAGVTVTLLAIAGMFASFELTNSQEFAYLIFGTGALTLPLSVGIAILKYRLYDIDIIINRALVYTTLTGSLAAVYFGSVVLLQQLLRAPTGQTSQFAIVASTLATAVLFQPLRQRIQTFIDRRFYRRKYDAARVLQAFSTQLRDEVDLNRLSDELLPVVEETIQPAHVSLWLRDVRTR